MSTMELYILKNYSLSFKIIIQLHHSLLHLLPPSPPVHTSLLSFKFWLIFHYLYTHILKFINITCLMYVRLLVGMLSGLHRHEVNCAFYVWALAVLKQTGDPTLRGSRKYKNDLSFVPLSLDSIELHSVAIG